jgi:hypothetical protein
MEPTPPHTPDRRHSTPGRTGFLLAALLVLVALSPWLSPRLVGRALWEVLFTIVMLSTIYVFGLDRRQAATTVVLAVPTVASLWIGVLVPGSDSSKLGLLLLIGFLLYTIAVLLRQVFTARTVTMDTLAGAFCIYLLMGFFWGGVYALIYLLAPDAIHIPDPPTVTADRGVGAYVPLSNMFYFSFTTLTTVAYGDILPVDPGARSASMLEGLLGQFYLTVLVARLVGIHIADMRR